ncbi:MAG: hypothetical protein PW734_04235 [Verrucomicrobium sp.]|nr:hypothetical protein [Verrucomicrobium sp.]
MAEAFERFLWPEGARLRAVLAVLALAAFAAAAWLAVGLPQGSPPALAQHPGQPLPAHATPAAPELFVLAGVPASADEIVSF